MFLTCTGIRSIWHSNIWWHDAHNKGAGKEPWQVLAWDSGIMGFSRSSRGTTNAQQSPRRKGWCQVHQALIGPHCQKQSATAETKTVAASWQRPCVKLVAKPLWGCQFWGLRIFVSHAWLSLYMLVALKGLARWARMMSITHIEGLQNFWRCRRSSLS